MPNPFRNLPSVSELLESPPLKSLIERVNGNVVVGRVKQILDEMQSQLSAAAASMHVPAASELALRIADWISNDRGPAILPVINATGTILHPQLGGAPLAEETLAELAALTRSYASFNLNLASGCETSAVATLERRFQRATGVEAATVTSSLPGAVFIALSAMAANHEVIVARGDITAIGGSDVPDLFRLSGAALREVGTANITRMDDYAAAISPRSAAILQVTASGYAVVGTVVRPPLDEIGALATRSGLPLIHCLTQAAWMDLSPYGITNVPDASQALRSGVDLTIFPGDGFLGGPTCGIIAGRRLLVEKLERHPLMPCLRADNLTISALGATLRFYEDQETAQRAIPVLSLLATPLENLRQRAERIAPQIAATQLAAVEIVASQSYVAGHEIPGQSLPTITLSLSPREETATQLADALRTGTPAVVGSVKNDRLVLDLRSVMPRDDLALIQAFTALARSRAAQPDASSVET